MCFNFGNLRRVKYTALHPLADLVLVDKPTPELSTSIGPHALYQFKLHIANL